MSATNTVSQSVSVNSLNGQAPYIVYATNGVTQLLSLTDSAVTLQTTTGQLQILANGNATFQTTKDVLIQGWTHSILIENGGISFTGTVNFSGAINCDSEAIFGELDCGDIVAETITCDAVRVGANQVVGAQGAAIADAVASVEAVNPTVAEYNTLLGKFNTLLARLRAHGLIAT